MRKTIVQFKHPNPIAYSVSQLTSRAKSKCVYKLCCYTVYWSLIYEYVPLTNAEKYNWKNSPLSSESSSSSAQSARCNPNQRNDFLSWKQHP